MKNLLKDYSGVIIVVVFFLTSLTSCARTMDYVIDNETFFVGEVISISESYVTVNLNKSDPLYGEYFLIQVSLDAEYKDSFLNLSVGDEIAVYYDGDIVENTVKAVYAICLRTPASRAFRS